MAEKIVSNAPNQEVKNILVAQEVNPIKSSQINVTRDIKFPGATITQTVPEQVVEKELNDVMTNLNQEVEQKAEKPQDAKSQTVISELNVEQILEEEAPAAGLAGGGEGEGHSFVVLGRILEEVSPVSYDYPINPAGTSETITGDVIGVAQEAVVDETVIQEEPQPPEPPNPPNPPFNTLVDGNEEVEGIFNTTISGNLLDNTERQEGETYIINSFTVNGVSYNTGTPAEIAGVGNILIQENGQWSFTPNKGYEGSVPVVEYNVFDGDLTDNSTLTIGDIVKDVDEVILPTLSIDLEVDPGAEKLVGNYTNADSITVTLTGDDGSSYELAGVLNSDGTWYADISLITFEEDVSYKAQAIAQNEDGIAEAFDIDLFTIEPPPNTLADDNENVIGLFNQTISGNLLDNTEKQVGEIYTVTEFIINGQTHAAGNTVDIPNVGNIFIDTNGEWSFTPNHGYVGAVPLITYTVFDGELYDNSTLTINEITAEPYDYSFGNWFIAQSGNDSNQFYNLIEGNKQNSEMDFNVQIKGQADPIPNGAHLEVVFDITGTATVNEDFNLDVTSKFYDVDYRVEGNQLIVDLSGGDGGNLNGLPFEVTISTIPDSDTAIESSTLEMSEVKLILEDGRELYGDTWETNDSINFNINSPEVEIAATSNIDVMGDSNAIGSETFSWDAKSVANHQDTVISFNEGDKLDFHDLLSSQNHQIDFSVNEVENGTLITISDTTPSDTVVQEILLNNYFAPSVSEMATQLKTTGSYEA